MAVAMRTNGLHHAVSLGTIEVSSNPACASHFDRSYDSEDENMNRRRLRHTSSTELYPRTSVYSKGDIREQYCLTDRQLNSIERPRRDGFFGCLSRRGAPQSFLGVCVGRRAPSDENLAAYAPFYKYPRYQHQYAHDDKSPDSDLDSSYFRRQPASILSTAKIPDQAAGSRYTWMHLQTTGNNENVNCSNEQSSYHCPSHLGPSAAPPQSGPTTPRTKHVSFARSHTLTSFDDVNLGFRSSGRLKPARSQERLIGGKKPIIATGSIYEPTQMTQNAATQQSFAAATPFTMHPHPTVIHQHPHIIHPHQHGHSHTHQHHHGPIHFQTDQPISLLAGRTIVDELTGIEIGLMACPTQTLAPQSPEIVVVDRKFRNAMKTQATQTEVRKDGSAHVLALSPRTIHKVKVVSQGAQTNGIQNGMKLTKSLSEMPNGTLVANENKQPRDNLDQHHDAVHRTQSEEPPRSPLELFQAYVNGPNTISYYEPPPPLEAAYAIHASNTRRNSHLIEGRHQHTSAQSIATETPNMYSLGGDSSSVNQEDSYMANAFDYESNSLPRRACSYHRLESEFNSHSLPRRDPFHTHDICKHITECSELMGDSIVMDFTKPHLLPPPLQYCKDEGEEAEHAIESPKEEPKAYTEPNRRMSMVVIVQPDTNDTPFRRDDVRRQSMPVYVKTEKLIDGHGTRTLLRPPGKHGGLFRDASEEKEILIDFKPHITPKLSPKQHQIYRKLYKTVSDEELFQGPAQQSGGEDECESCQSVEPSVKSDEDEEQLEHKGDPLYENIPSCLCTLSDSQDMRNKEREQFRKRSVSLDDANENVEKTIGVSAPPSPCRDELLANVSTYPSSDSLANDVTRDHSDGIWNESQVTVLTVEGQKDISESSYNSNLLLTPSSKRKNLILQHQQRSSIDTDVLDLEEQFTDHSPTYSNVSLTKTFKAATSAMARGDQKSTLSVPMKIVTPSIAVTPSFGGDQELEFTSPRKSPNNSRRPSYNYVTSPLGSRKGDLQKNADNSYLGRTDAAKFNVTNTDVSECSTNTDEYATCTDTSKRTPGIKTPPTTTSSSSTTQVPVSTQSSQMDKTHGGSSFESASSLYSTRGEVLSEDAMQLEDKSLKVTNESEIKLGSPTGGDIAQKSPTHSISSTSSGSYNVAGLNTKESAKTSATISPSRMAGSATQQGGPEKAQNKLESISDDERSEMRYSSSGYYESPHDEDHTAKSRRHRQDEDRKRRKTSMKLDIEKENMRALTSPIKKPQTTAVIAKERSPEKQQQQQQQQPEASVADTASPNKIKRFRPKIRRQFRRSSRDESTPRRPKNIVTLYGLSSSQGSTEKLLDCSITAKPEERLEPVSAEPKAKPIIPPNIVKSASEACQLKAKSVESLRSVSPGSDSVFYSEADGTGADPHGHCLHCGKEMEGQNSVISGAAGDSVESLPCIENEQDIVKPPSDFADSPVTTKTTQRLYKKMDKRFRSEERYHGERGRHYKSRQENIRAKSEERSRENHTRSPHTLRPAGSSPCVLPDATSEQNQQIIYRGHYDPGRYTRLTDADVWMQLDHQSFDRQRDRRSSTESERSFHSKYQVILHRLVQRRCTLEMYHRQKNNLFQLISSNSSPDSVRRKLEEVLKLMLLVWAREGHVLSKITGGAHGVDKTVVVKSDSGEFGFRIHGSKPVVVAAIEPDTPAESSGLEVGDIIISVNGVQVLDKHHTEVVKIAHDGCETLELQVARTIGILMNEQKEPRSQPIYSGYLWRQSGQAKGSPNAKKWVRRWFCLRPDNCLYYYKTEDDTQPVGAMIMAKHTMEHCPPEIGKPFAFKVDSGEGIPMYVAADSEELASRWMNVLQQSAVQGSPWLDKCARNLYQQPSNITRPDCFGYLMKLGSRWCGWSKRYCVLKDACLYFYQDANSKTAFGMACLHGYKVASMSTSASGKKNSFEIIPPETKLRHYYFCTESEMDKKRWISALEYSIDRWIKSG